MSWNTSATRRLTCRPHSTVSVVVAVPEMSWPVGLRQRGQRRFFHVQRVGEVDLVQSRYSPRASNVLCRCWKPCPSNSSALLNGRSGARTWRPGSGSTTHPAILHPFARRQSRGPASSSVVVLCSSSSSVLIVRRRPPSPSLIVIIRLWSLEIFAEIHRQSSECSGSANTWSRAGAGP